MAALLLLTAVLVPSQTQPTLGELREETLSAIDTEALYPGSAVQQFALEVLDAADMAITEAATAAAEKATAETIRRYEPEVARYKAERDAYRDEYNGMVWPVRLWRGLALTVAGSLGGYVVTGGNWTGAGIGAGVGAATGIGWALGEGF